MVVPDSMIVAVEVIQMLIWASDRSSHATAARDIPDGENSHQPIIRPTDRPIDQYTKESTVCDKTQKRITSVFA